MVCEQCGELAKRVRQLSPRLQQHIRAAGMDQDAALPLRLVALWERQHARGGR